MALSTMAREFLLVGSLSCRLMLSFLSSLLFFKDTNPGALSTLSVISEFLLVVLVVEIMPSSRSFEDSDWTIEVVTKSEKESLVTKMNCLDLRKISLTKIVPGAEGFVTEEKCFISLGKRLLATQRVHSSVTCLKREFTWNP